MWHALMSRVLFVVQLLSVGAAMNGSSGPPGRPGAPLRVAAYLALWSELVFSCFRAGTAKNSSSKVPSRQLTPNCYGGAKIPLHATVLFVILRVKFLRSLARYRTAHLTMIGWQSIVVLNCKSLLRFVSSSKIKLRCGRAVPGSDNPQEGLHGQIVSDQLVFV